MEHVHEEYAGEIQRLKDTIRQVSRATFKSFCEFLPLCIHRFTKHRLKQTPVVLFMVYQIPCIRT